MKNHVWMGLSLFLGLSVHAQPPCHHPTASLNSSISAEWAKAGIEIPNRYCMLDIYADFPSFSVTGELVIRFAPGDVRKFKAVRQLDGEDIYKMTAVISEEEVNVGACGAAYFAVTTIEAHGPEFGGGVDFTRFVRTYSKVRDNCHSVFQRQAARIVYEAPSVR